MLIILITIILLALTYSVLPTLTFRIFFKTRNRTQQNEKSLFLTFDDGPSAEYTGKLLNLLAKHQVKASFFVVSEFAKQNVNVIDRICLEGHTIGIHSQSHKSVLFRGYYFLKRDFSRSLEDMRDLGLSPVYYRPPWGQLNLLSFHFMRKYELKLILWNVMAEDWSASATAKSIEKKLLRRTKPGSIICLHDGRGAPGAPERTIQALEKTIPQLQQMGYHFLRLEDACDEDNN